MVISFILVRLIVTVAGFTDSPSEIEAVITGFVSKSNKAASATVNSPVDASILKAPKGVCVYMLKFKILLTLVCMMPILCPIVGFSSIVTDKS